MVFALFSASSGGNCNCSPYERKIQAALDNNNPAAAKWMLEQYSCDLRDHIPNEKDERLRQHMIETANLLDENLCEIDPDKDCSKENLHKFIEGIFLFAKLTDGFLTGLLDGFVEGTIRLVKQGTETGLCRLKKGDLLGTVTGIMAGGLHGVNQGGGDGLFTGLGRPLQK